MGDFIDGMMKNIKANPWRLGVVILTVLLILCMLTRNGFTDRFSQGPDPTEVVTLYYKPNCPSCQPAYYHWAMLSRNLRTDGRIRTRSVNCDDPAYANECNRWSGHPIFVRRQASGREHRFRGNLTYQNLYNFANRDY